MTQRRLNLIVLTLIAAGASLVGASTVAGQYPWPIKATAVGITAAGNQRATQPLSLSAWLSPWPCPSRM